MYIFCAGRDVDKAHKKTLKDNDVPETQGLTGCYEKPYHHCMADHIWLNATNVLVATTLPHKYTFW